MERKCAFNQQPEQASLDNIQHKIIVLSGKGGVGKSTVAINLAAGLVQSERKVGLMDIDIHGPSIPTMLGISERKAGGDSEGIDPVMAQGFSIMSVGFFLQHPDSPIIYRGPAKASLIRQFVTEVKWGSLDYLIIDAPPRYRG